MRRSPLLCDRDGNTRMSAIGNLMRLTTRHSPTKLPVTLVK
jgi:hypothetical protein